MPKSRNRKKNGKQNANTKKRDIDSRDSVTGGMVELSNNVFSYGVSLGDANKIKETDQFKRLKNGSKIMFIYDNLLGTGMQPFEKEDFESFVLYIGSKQKVLSLFCRMFDAYFLARASVVLITEIAQGEEMMSSIRHNLGTPTNFALAEKLIGTRKKYAIKPLKWIRVGDDVYE